MGATSMKTTGKRSSNILANLQRLGFVSARPPDRQSAATRRKLEHCVDAQIRSGHVDVYQAGEHKAEQSVAIFFGVFFVCIFSACMLK